MSMRQAMTWGRWAVLAAVLAFGGMCWAADPALPMPVVPDDFGRWPVVALMAFICLASLGLAALCVVKAFAIAAPLSALQTQGQETNRRLDEMAGKLGDERARPCGMEKPEFREWLKEVAGK